MTLWKNSMLNSHVHHMHLHYSHKTVTVMLGSFDTMNDGRVRGFLNRL